MDQAQVLELLDTLYGKCVHGIPKMSESIEQMAF